MRKWRKLSFFVFFCNDSTHLIFQAELQSKFASGIAKAQSGNSGYKFEMVPVKVDRDVKGPFYNDTCNVAKSQSFSAIVDLTWGGWHEFKMEAEKNGMPYIRLEGANHQFVKVSRYVDCRNIYFSTAPTSMYLIYPISSISTHVYYSFFTI